jgi:hypothetical protein
MWMVILNSHCLIPHPVVLFFIIGTCILPSSFAQFCSRLDACFMYAWMLSMVLWSIPYQRFPWSNELLQGLGGDSEHQSLVFARIPTSALLTLKLSRVKAHTRTILSRPLVSFSIIQILLRPLVVLSSIMLASYNS